MQNKIELISAEDQTVKTFKFGKRGLIAAAKEHVEGQTIRANGFNVHPLDISDMKEMNSDEARGREYARWCRDRIFADLDGVDRDGGIEPRRVTIEWEQLDSSFARFTIIADEETTTAFKLSLARCGFMETGWNIDAWRFARPFAAMPEGFAALAERGWKIAHSGDIPYSRLVA